jgi:hypothetical protein
MPAEMRLIGKTGFGRHVYDREIFFWRRQKLLAVTQSATHQVLVRGQADAVGKQFTEIRDAQTRGARHFFAAQLRGKIGFHQSDSATDATRLISQMAGIRSLLLALFIHTPFPKRTWRRLKKEENYEDMTTMSEVKKKIFWHMQNKI